MAILGKGIAMSVIKVYAKSRIDLNQKIGAYTFILDDLRCQRLESKSFKMSVKTLAHADCAAFVNALAILASTEAGAEVQVLEVVTDSGVVAELLEIYKFQKHCEDVMLYWKEKVRPLFVNLRQFKVIKVGRKPIAGDPNTFNMQKCEVLSTQALDRLIELIK